MTTVINDAVAFPRLSPDEIDSLRGFGDERAYHYGPYGESLEPKLEWAKAPLTPTSKPKGTPRPPRFIGAFVAPPPWRQYATEPREYDDRAESIEPCIWKLPE